MFYVLLKCSLACIISRVTFISTVAFLLSSEGDAGPAASQAAATMAVDTSLLAWLDFISSTAFVRMYSTFSLFLYLVLNRVVSFSPSVRMVVLNRWSKGFK
ncbi:hypothetical protein XENOCAPTIV_009944 [Xenoophorus captivus]|uniref:Secreted protein n=1 Tax=Xenoophorus captivus TaxID=1517983 RepID=A0ABV0RPQ4_9TELE